MGSVERVLSIEILARSFIESVLPFLILPDCIFDFFFGHHCTRCRNRTVYHTTTVLQSSPEAYTTINYSYPHPTIYLSMHEGGREEVLCITEHCNIACVPSQSPPTCVHTWVSGVSGRVQSKGIGVTPS